MSERYEKNPSTAPEQFNTPPNLNEAAPHKVEQKVKDVENLNLKESNEILKSARRAVEKESQATEKIAEALAQRNETERPSPPVASTSKEIKEMAYERLLTRARHHLAPYSRLMSHIIHQPVIDAVSEATGKTVARPSGFLGGGIVAFLGTCVYYYIAKHYGYSYNAFVFVLLLVGGFIAGWITEMLYRFLRMFIKK